MLCGTSKAAIVHLAMTVDLQGRRLLLDALRNPWRSSRDHTVERACPWDGVGLEALMKLP